MPPPPPPSSNAAAQYQQLQLKQCCNSAPIGTAHWSSACHTSAMSFPSLRRLVIVAVVLSAATVLPNCTGDILVYTREPPQLLIEEFRDMPAHFGPSLPDTGLQVLAVGGSSVDKTSLPDGCSPLRPPPVVAAAGVADSEPYGNGSVLPFVVIVPRGNCEFLQKVRNAQRAGYAAVIVYNLDSNNLEPMSAKDADGIDIPSVFVGELSGQMLLGNYQYQHDFVLVLNGDLPFDINTRLILPFSIVVGLCFLIMMGFVIMKCMRERRRQRRHRLPRSALKSIPVLKFNKLTMSYETCIICLDDYTDGEKIRVLPCDHAYHCKCIDEWLTNNRRVCPICKRKVLLNRHPNRRLQAAAQAPQHPQRSSDDSMSDSDADDSTPLLNPVENSAAAAAAASQNHGTFTNSASGSQRVNPFDRSPNLPPNLRSESVEHRTISQRIASFWRRSNRNDLDPERATLVAGSAGAVVEIAAHLSNTINEAQHSGDDDDDDSTSNTLRSSNIYEPSSSQQGRLGVVAIPNLEFCPQPAAPSSSPHA